MEETHEDTGHVVTAQSSHLTVRRETPDNINIQIITIDIFNFLLVLLKILILKNKFEFRLDFLTFQPNTVFKTLNVFNSPVHELLTDVFRF